MVSPLKIDRTHDLHEDLHSFINACRHDAAAITTDTANEQMRGRANALHHIATWLECMVGKSAMSDDLATHIADCLCCLADECEEANSAEQQDVSAEAQGKVSAYADVRASLSQLFNAHYPQWQFSPTRTSDSISASEWKRLAHIEEIPKACDVPPEDVRELLSRVEIALCKHHKRVLVHSEPGREHTTLAWYCIDRLRGASSDLRVLVIAGHAALKPAVTSAFEEMVSQVDNAHLTKLSYKRRRSSEGRNQTHICVSTLREVQTFLPRTAEGKTRNDRDKRACIAPDAFDAIVMCGDANPAAHEIWQQVWRYFQAPYRIGFVSMSTSLLMEMFDQKVA